MPTRTNKTASRSGSTTTRASSAKKQEPHVCPQCNGNGYLDFKETFSPEKLERITRSAMKPLTTTGAFIYGGMDRFGSALTSRIPSKLANQSTLMMDTLYEKGIHSKPLSRLSNKAVSFAGYFLDPIAKASSVNTSRNTKATNNKNKK